ncbi:MAG: hypothetical protein V3V63_00475, partial [Candidatus Hydrothermarchaeaceae archaeon]
MDVEALLGFLVFDFIFYSLFILPYVFIQKGRDREIRPKTMMVGGTFVLVFLVIIISEKGVGYPGGDEIIYMIFWALVIIGLIHLWGPKFQSKEKEEPKE